MFLIDLEFDFIQDVLDTLLKDKTTGKNIIWATKDYEHFGSEYSFNSELTVSSVLGLNNQELQPRVHKSKEYQKGRTKERAEVFTPSWVCKDMNDFCDAEWFGVEKDKLDYKYDKNHTFKKYIGLRKLEITCGEAPFIVSRYDAATGKSFSINDRIGFLDRKLQVINENIDDSLEWLKFVKMAYNSSYGYEYQGDNLLKARLNLLITFVEYYGYKFKAIPNKKDLKTISEIISKNIWQMDGLKYTVPNSDIYCKVFKGKTECYYKDLEGEKKMKFDFVVGNPPYQEETENRIADSSIYNLFMEGSYKIANKVELITPGRFLFNAGNTPRNWNDKMLHDKHFKVLKYFRNSREVFTGVDIRGGVAIHYRDKESIFGEIGVFTPFKELTSIVKKVKPFLLKGSLDSIIYLQNKYNLDILYLDYPELKHKIGSNGRERRLVSSCFECFEVFHKNKETNDDIVIQGVINNNQRVRFWINKKYIQEHRNLNKYKVLLPNSNGSGALGEVMSTPLVGEPLVGEPLVGYTQSFIGIGAFTDLFEVNAALKYIKSKFCRVMLGVLKVTQSNTPDKWRYVPLQDFTENSDIDWSKSIKEIDQQLYKKYGLDDKEIAFIEEKVKEME